MLSTLKIKNVALIKELTVEFSEGLNVLSGETGAGKSIMIDSLNFVLGGRADKTMLRSGEEKCSVEAVIELSNSSDAVYKVLDDMGIEREDAVILHRSMDETGKSRCLVNGQTVTASMLKNLTAVLADIHGQSEHHSLMKVSSHIELLDKFAGAPLTPLAEEVRRGYAALREIKKELSSFGGGEDERERTLDLLKYQIEEIEEAEIEEGEEEELKATRTKAVNVERLVTSLNEAANLLKRETGASLDTLGEALGSLAQVSQYDENVEEQRARLESLKYELEDVSECIAELGEGYEFNEGDLAEIERRLDTYRLLHKKYGASVEAVNAYLARAKKEYDRLSGSEAEIARLKELLTRQRNLLYESCQKLSENRREAAQRLEKCVMAELKDLGLKNAVFAVHFKEAPTLNDFDGCVSSGGMDEVEFYLTANLGQPLKPLVKVISGGEASRFMLAIKTITSDIDRIPLMVFDEIDTGISGEIAQMVSKKFALISQRHQLLAITHLPQIAAMGDSNYLIEKHSDNETTVTDVTRLTKEAREREIARLAGGSNIGEHGVLHARELIGWCDTFKKSL